MATQILSQIIEYDKSARAWAQIGREGMTANLVKYHDTREQAMVAALPDDLREWVQAHSNRDDVNGRYLRAAQIIANDEIHPNEYEFGLYHAKAHTIPDWHYTIDCPARSCTCKDSEYGNYCKHLIAANYLFNIYLAENSDTLYALALRTLNEIPTWAEHNRQKIWISADGTRYAALYCLRDYIYLEVSGHDVEDLRLAYTTKDGTIMIANYHAYLAFVRELRGG